MAKLLKGESARVSRPDSVVDAPPLIEMLLRRPCFSSRSRGEPGSHSDPRMLRRARSYARRVRQTMKIGLTALTLRPACVVGVFLVRRRKFAVGAMSIAVHRPWRCCPEMECLALKSIPMAWPVENLLEYTTGVLTLQTCFHLWRNSPIFSADQGCRTSTSR